MKFLNYNILLLLAIVVVSSTANAQIPASNEKPEVSIYLAKDDGEGKAGDPVTEFKVSDIPIHCVVKLESSESATVKMQLVAVKVSGVRAETKVVSASYTTTEGQNEVYFHGKPQKLWVAGIYRADIYLNGTMVRSIEFPIKGISVPPVANGFVPVKPKSKIIKRKP